MRAVLQRVTSASVRVDGDVVGVLSIPAGTHGLVALIGVTHGDTPDTAAKLADKIWRLRILAGEKSAADLDAPVLVISQFTLYANTDKGRRPSWNAAAPGSVAEPLVDAVIASLRASGAHVRDRQIRRKHAGRTDQRRPGHHIARGVKGAPDAMMF